MPPKLILLNRWDVVCFPMNPQLKSHHDFIGLPQILAVFKKFQERIGEIEELIKARNQEKMLKNRYGSVAIPYELLYPSSDSGLTGRGVPNSTSI